MSALQSVIFICCGPGLTGCANSCDKLPKESPEVTVIKPGVLQWRHTDITITYDPIYDSWHVEGHGANKVGDSYDEALEKAEELELKLAAAGIKP